MFRSLTSLLLALCIATSATAESYVTADGTRLSAAHGMWVTADADVDANGHYVDLPDECANGAFDFEGICLTADNFACTWAIELLGDFDAPSGWVLVGNGWSVTDQHAMRATEAGVEAYAAENGFAYPPQRAFSFVELHRSFVNMETNAELVQTAFVQDHSSHGNHSDGTINTYAFFEGGCAEELRTTADRAAEQAALAN